MAPFNLFDCERSTNVRVNVVYFTEYLTLLCLIKSTVILFTSSRHATFPSVSGPTEDAPNTFLFFYIANHSCRAGASPFSSLLFSSSCGSALQGAAAGGGAETALAGATPPQLLATGSRRAALVAAAGAP
jgi:hypothetical protein